MSIESERDPGKWQFIEVEGPAQGPISKAYAVGLAWSNPTLGGLVCVIERKDKPLFFKVWASRGDGQAELGRDHITREVSDDRVPDLLARVTPILGRAFGPDALRPAGYVCDPRWIVAPREADVAPAPTEAASATLPTSEPEPAAGTAAALADITTLEEAAALPPPPPAEASPPTPEESEEEKAERLKREAAAAAQGGESDKGSDASPSEGGV